MAEPRSLNPFRVLQTSRNFRLFWIGQTISLVGSWMQQVAVGWTALELTNDPFLVGLVAAAGNLPILLFSIPGGLVADRNEKLRVVRVAQGLMLVEAAALWAMSLSGHLTIGWLLALTAFGGTLAAFEIPARQSLIVELVGKEDLPQAIGLNSTGFNLARVAGPAVAGLVIANFGMAWTYFLNALSYLAVLVGLGMIVLPERRAVTRAHASTVEGLREGLHYVRDTVPLPGLMLIATFFSLFGIPVLTLLPVIARDLGLGADGYAGLLACIGVGAVGGALGVAATHGGPRPGRTLYWASFAFPTVLILFSFTGQHIFAGLLLVGVGIAMIVNNALVNARLQVVVPDGLRGRVMSLYVMVYIGASPVGSFVAGVVAKRTDAAFAVGSAAVLMLLFSIWVFRRYPALSAD